MMLYKNEVLVNEEVNKRYRVLWIDETNYYCYLIDMEDETALPFLKEVNEILEDVTDGYFIKDRTNSVIVVDEHTISQSAIEKRDAAWKMIQDAVVQEPDIYIAEIRGKIIKEVVERFQVTKKTVYKYLRRYWQSGKSPNGLIPYYMNSGGKGKKKKPTKKMGRPSKFKDLQSEVIVDDEMKKIFRIALQKYYLTNKRNRLPFAYQMMIRRFFIEDTYYENGQLQVEIKDRKYLPTLDQLRYFLKTEYSETELKKSRIGQAKFDKTYRELLGSSTFESFGPGSRFQIDATIADVYLVSEYNPNWIIGRPILYVVIDVFSRVIVGIYVGLEGPSWAGAMMALANTVDNKVEFCAKYGIEITKDQWPSEHIPKVILTDRGEFEGFNPERLVRVFNLHVENAAPFRADWKGIVEKYFDIIQTKVKPFLPGYVEKDFNERGARDYRLDAKLTLNDYTQIIIHEVLHHNNHHYLNKYPRDVDMVRDEVEPIPIQLWNWGIQNRSGILVYHTPDTVKLHLLPQKEAVISKNGIKFNEKMLYTCETAIKESWFSKARIQGSWRVSVAYDPRDMTQIYLLTNNGSAYEICSLVDHQEERYQHKSLEDIKYLHEVESYMEKKNKQPQLKSDINLINRIEEIVQPASKRTEKGQDHSISKTQRVRSISDNRAMEKENNRKHEKFVFSEKGGETSVERTQIEEEVIPEENFNRKSIKEILRKAKIGGDGDE